MLSRPTLFASALCAAALSGALALPGAAQAQPPGGPSPRMDHGGPDMPDMPGMPGMAEMKAMHEAMMKQHVEDLKTVLRLRPDQEPALQAFLAAHQPPEMKMMGPPPGPPAPKTTPERLADEAKREQAVTARREKMRDALAKFYAALSPDQQKVFDALQRLGGHGPGMGPGMGHRRMMMMGGMGDGPQIRRIEIRRGGPGGGPGAGREHGRPPGHKPD